MAPDDLYLKAHAGEQHGHPRAFKTPAVFGRGSRDTTTRGRSSLHEIDRAPL